MKLLLDTHILLWAANEPSKLSETAYEAIANTANELLFSAASIWEIVIKNSLGRPDFDVDAHQLRRGLVDNGYDELAITSEHVLAVATLPCLHRNPFDRILVAQATTEGLRLLTADQTMADYRGPIQQV